jgi:transcriptional regulator
VHVVPADHALAHLDALTARFEHDLLAPKPGWTSDRLALPRLDMLLQAIVAIEMMVETIEGKFKLNQHKPDADHLMVANSLARQGATGARAIASRMVALRPHLLYEERRAVSAHDSGASPSHGGGI